MKIAIFIGLFAISLGHLHFEIEGIDLSTTTLTVTEKYFESYKDHFNKVQLGTFDQRYWEMLEYWDKEDPKAILYICGESQGKFPKEGTLPLVAAQELGAAVFSLEHRFYGESQPTEDWSVESLKLLTFEQALADIAYFIENMNVELKENYGKAPKWVVIGGSYAGAMSAWFRYKYPHLVVGSISSSGVVNAIDDFQDYEKQVVIGLKACGGNHIEQLRAQQVYADQQIYSNDPNIRNAFFELFNATDMEALDFQYYYADIPVAWIHGGKRASLCKFLDEIKEGEVQEQIAKLAEATAAIGHTVDNYRFTKLMNTTIDPENRSRQWYYQVCTSFGWFQTAYAEEPIRSETLDLDYWRKYCAKIFPGEDLFPNVRRTNNYMGELEIEHHTSNTFFTQGSEDGWKWAGLMGSRSNEQIIIKEIMCDTCSHCIDLKVASEGDPEILKEVRLSEIAAMGRWFS